MDNLDKILEGLLFLSGDGLDRGVIMEKLQVTPKQLDKAVETLKQRYNEDCGINMITYKDKLQLCASPKFADDVSLVLNPIRERQLTKATLEVMAIIAYKQPVTRIDVQDIRGINSDYAIQTLLNYKLIEVVGRKDAVGKPLLFGTTDEFLRHFGINNLYELPDYDELMKSVQKIQLESNHLYNEFEIPDDEEQNIENEQNNNEENALKNSINLDVIKAENISEDIEQKSNESLNDLQEEALTDEMVFEMQQNDKKNTDENNQIINEDMPLEEMLENENFDKEIISQESEILNLSNLQNDDNNFDGGIDWSLLENNPDIDK